MDCPKCGVPNAEGSSGCRACGALLVPTLPSLGSAPRPAPGSAPVWPPADGAEASGRVGGRGYVPRVPSHMVWAILSLFFFFPSGILAVGYASKVDNLLARGDIAGAWGASGKSKAWCIVSTVLFIVWAILLVGVLALVFGMGMDIGFL